MPFYRRFTYCLLLLALIPLIISTFKPHVSLRDHLFQSIEAHPEVDEQVSAIVEAHQKDEDPGDMTDEIIATLPGHHVDGALLALESHAHWVIALAFAVAYFLFLLLFFKGSRKYTKGLLFSGIFTGTAGILLLLAFQFAAFSMPLIIPRGIVGLILLIVKLIGLSYSLADDPNKGFLLSFVGYTCGVGLCEEITKIIPLLFRIKPIPGEEDPTWNSLLLWGLASGFGFGIAEGIMYSGRYYNGIEGLDMYLVRFISCVTLHAMWAGAAGIMVYRRQGDLLGAGDNWTYCGRVVLIVLVPMTLHGLYDTLLKKDLDALALVVAVASFAWLAFQIERQQKQEPLAIAS